MSGQCGEIHVARLTGGTEVHRARSAGVLRLDILRAPAVGASPSCSVWNTFVEWEDPFYIC